MRGASTTIQEQANTRRVNHNTREAYNTATSDQLSATPNEEANTRRAHHNEREAYNTATTTTNVKPNNTAVANQPLTNRVRHTKAKPKDTATEKANITATRQRYTWLVDSLSRLDYLVTDGQTLPPPHYERTTSQNQQQESHVLQPKHEHGNHPHQ